MDEMIINIGNKYLHEMQVRHRHTEEILREEHNKEIQSIIKLFEILGMLYQRTYNTPTTYESLKFNFNVDTKKAETNIDNLIENQKQKENENMPKPLKYGQGGITLRTRKNKNGTEYKYYQARYYDKYGIRHTITAKTQAEALRILNNNNKRSLRTIKRKQPITFGKDLQNWFDTFKKPRIQKGSIYSYQKLLNSIPESIKKKLLHQVSEIELQNFLNNTVSEKNRYWAKMLLQNYFEVAFNKGIIKCNLGKLLYADQPIPAERQTLPKDKESDFINALPEVYRNHAIAVLYSGCRINEVFRIEPEDLDYKKNIIWIKETKTLKRGERKTTPYKLRPAYLFPELKNIKFPLPSICLSWLRKAFKKASEKIGITITPHDLRHTYATRLDEMGINREVILFHGNIKMTKHYIHEDKERKLIKEFEKFNKNQSSTPISTPIESNLDKKNNDIPTDDNNI